MKKILDRLLARQGRLMAELAVAEVGKGTVLSAPILADPEAEAQAIEAANALLALGDLSGAAKTLLPFQNGATSVRTLTTLSRIRSAAGSFDEARSLLEQAYVLDPTDIKVPHFTAELLDLQGKHREAITYRRRVAFGTASPNAGALVELIRTITKGASADKGISLREVRMAVDHFLACADRTSQQALEVAQLVYSIVPMQDEAVHLYEAADPCPADHVDVRVEWRSILSWCASEGSELLALAEGGRPGKRPMVARVANALIIEDFQFTPIVSKDQIALSGGAHRNQRLRSQGAPSPLLMTDAVSCRLRLPRHRDTVSEPCVLVGGVGSYYHDLIEYIGSLATVEQLGVHQGRRLVLNADAAPFQIELLSLLGYGAENLLFLPRHGGTTFSDLLVPSNLAHGGRWIDPMLVSWYRRRLAPASVSARRKLYLSRRLAGERKVDNSDEIEFRLTALGFDIVSPEQLSVREQVALFSEAACIVGSTGAALTNMIFAPPGAKVVVCYNRVLTQAKGSLYFDALAEACGHEFSLMACAPTRLATGDKLTDADLHIDAEALVALIS